MNNLTELSKKYSTNPILRSVISIIPYVGGSLDILLTEKWNSFYQKRIEQMLGQLSIDLKDLEGKVDEEYLGSEEFFDVIYKVLNEAFKTRLEEKRKIYSKIIRDSITSNKETMETESILEIVSSLYEKDLIFIYKIAEIKKSIETFEFTGEEMLVFLSNEKFDKNEIVRILFRFSSLGLLDYKMNILTLREKVKFSTTLFFDNILKYLEE
jgi:hypothetical protein